MIVILESGETMTEEEMELTISESWYNATHGGYLETLSRLSLEEKVDDMMDFDAIVAEFPRDFVKTIIEKLILSKVH